MIHRIKLRKTSDKQKESLQENECEDKFEREHFKEHKYLRYQWRIQGYLSSFAENSMKTKKFGPGGGGVPPRSANVYFVTTSNSYSTFSSYFTDSLISPKKRRCPCIARKDSKHRNGLIFTLKLELCCKVSKFHNFGDPFILTFYCKYIIPRNLEMLLFSCHFRNI